MGGGGGGGGEVWDHQIWYARTNLEGLLKTHSHSVKDGSLRTLMAEAEIIINFGLSTVEIISDSRK